MPISARAARLRVPEHGGNAEGSIALALDQPTLAGFCKKSVCVIEMPQCHPAYAVMA